MWPGIATPTLWGRTAGACFVLGGVLVGALTWLAPGHFDHAGVQYANAALATFLGVCVLLTGYRVALWQFHVLVAVATLQITVSVIAATGPAAVSFATLYAFVACAAFFVAWPMAVAHLTLATVCCMAALSTASDVPWWTGVVTSATTAAIGAIITILGRIMSKAEFDDATQVPNRRGFERLFGAEIARAASTETGPAVALLCVDNYSSIHDEFGDRAGDALMHQLVEQWRGLLSPGQVMARRGDAEFVLMLPGTTEDEAFALVQKLRGETNIEFCAGVSAWEFGESASPVLDRADVALRRAKSTGRNRTMLESSQLPPLAVQLREALAAESVGVRYQSIVRLDEDATIVGVEALLRWSPELGPDLEAGEVIRVAEDNDLIAPLDQYVLRRACLDALWMQEQAPGTPLSLNVNVSGLELVEQGYVERVTDTLAATGWPAAQLVLEVTETVIDVDRPASIQALHELRSHGIRIAIDDFGTGYSSLSRLQKLPTDVLKLDASFTSSIDTASASTLALLHAVAGLGESLALPIVAEGVETEDEASVIRSLGFTMAQGYFFGRPQTRQDVVAAIADAAARKALTQGTIG